MMASRVPLSLKQFMVRQQVLKLYKDLLKTIRTVPDVNSRQDLLDWVRRDFREHKHQNDEHTIKALLFYGQRTLNELQQSLQLSK